MIYGLEVKKVLTNTKVRIEERSDGDFDVTLTLTREQGDKVTTLFGMCMDLVFIQYCGMSEIFADDAYDELARHITGFARSEYL